MKEIEDRNGCKENKFREIKVHKNIPCTQTGKRSNKNDPKDNSNGQAEEDSIKQHIMRSRRVRIET